MRILLKKCSFDCPETAHKFELYLLTCCCEKKKLLQYADKTERERRCTLFYLLAFKMWESSSLTFSWGDVTLNHLQRGFHIWGILVCDVDYHSYRSHSAFSGILKCLPSWGTMTGKESWVELSKSDCLSWGRLPMGGCIWDTGSDLLNICLGEEDSDQQRDWE